MECSYLMTYSLCEKFRYRGKLEYQVKIMINELKNDVKRLSGSPYGKHFQEHNYEFNLEVKFSILELTENLQHDKSELKKFGRHLDVMVRNLKAI